MPANRIAGTALVSLLVGAVLIWPGAPQAADVAEKREGGQSAKAVELASWQPPADMRSVAFSLGTTSPTFRVWGGGDGQRFFFDELLPALVERTLVVDEFDPRGELAWIFTGEHGGFTVTVKSQQVELVQRFYDSPAFNEIAGKKPGRYPQWSAQPATVAFTGKLQAVTVTLDAKFGLSVALNGREVLQQPCWLDVSRHQLRWRNADSGAAVRGKLLSPEAVAAKVEVNPAAKHQEMIGFGGIASPTAYVQLSSEGRRLWWQMLKQYNLLIQREYPNGQRLNEAMDNWDRLADAVPHYYGDNFPNGEISDFAYIKTLRGLGGKVWFEFWALPPWVGDDVEKYADAMVRYCQVSKEKAGAPPEVVGVQNEVKQTAEQFQKMTLTLRRKLDAAGFESVRIHMSDDGRLRGGIGRAEAFRSSPKVWAAIDYAASHMYDYQQFFTNPDGFDPMLLKWSEAIGDKPFLSTELCINTGQYQLPTYRTALAMGQLYHKNLVLTDAAAICYCWLLVNVEQPSFGWTRTLCVPDTANGFVPKASSHQLRVFGAYSRRIREGMTRVEAKTGGDDLLVSAFDGGSAGRTVVLLNRSTRPRKVAVVWPGAKFNTVELADPYHPNEAAPAAGEVSVEPGAVVTLTSVALNGDEAANR